jgi:hypothetical protein
MKQVKGPGFGNGMFASIQKNAGMLRGIGYFDKRKEYVKASKKVCLEDYNEATPEQLQQIRVIYTEVKRQVIIKKILILIPAISLTIFLGFGFIFLMRLIFEF